MSRLVFAGKRPASFAEVGVRTIKTLIWIYIVLLVTEGALRKWILPELSAPLLIIRDPVVLLIYVISIAVGIFQRERMLMGVLVLALSFTIVTILDLMFGDANLFVSAYGLRTYFLHLPLIFVIGSVFTRSDLDRVAKVLCVIAVPMALLILLQFQSGPDHILNRTSTGEGTQIPSALGRIRPAGTFSFVTGVAQFFALVTAFVLYGIAYPGKLSRPLLLSGGICLLLSLAVSGSRTTILSSLLVCIAFLSGCLVKPQLARHVFRLLLLLCVAAAIAATTEVFHEGLTVMSARSESASKFEGQGGLAVRIINTFVGPFLLMESTPFFGYGAGVGTNVGAQLLTGRVAFLLAEGDWERTILEVGPLLGTAYLAMRVSIVLWLSWLCVCRTRKGDLLPLLLLGACGPVFLNGGFGQATTLGFACLGTGLCLAAARGRVSNEHPAGRKLYSRWPGKHAALLQHAQERS
ncbi:MAG TPA: hypothetical protein VEK08_13940 [Planctomycetota bacterium]|nr:hypothetical protein [Planctomycetota bacterium]